MFLILLLLCLPTERLSPPFPITQVRCLPYYLLPILLVAVLTRRGPVRAYEHQSHQHAAPLSHLSLSSTCCPAYQSSELARNWFCFGRLCHCPGMDLCCGLPFLDCLIVKNGVLRSVRLEQSRNSSVLPAQVLTLQRRSRFSGPSTQLIDKDPRIGE